MPQTPSETDLSRDEFILNLSQSGLFSKDEIEKMLMAPGVAEAGSTAAELARRLAASGVLTNYQVEALRERKFAELLIGNYEVLDRLGAGGMGSVYKARHRRMKRIVALKVLSRSLAADETFLRRFQREVETVARLSHPNIVMAHDADEAEAGPFLVMEFVDGHDLFFLVQKEGCLSVAAAVDCLLQAARGLEYAHGQNIIHRDIKPANLLRDAQGVVKLTDLGLARFNSMSVANAAGVAAGRITQAGGILGTVDFMPPEQAFEAASIDHRADIYSLGATLHFLLLGRPPYEGPTLMSTLLKHREAPIPSLLTARADVPAALDAIFQRMMAKAPADRFQTMTEVVRALAAVEAGLSERAASSLPGSHRPTDAVASGATGVWQSSETDFTALSSATSQTIDPRPPDKSPGISLNVLLVEPSRTQSAIIRSYLKGQGIQHIVAVASGEEALQAVRREPPGALISALHLADMTGVQLAQRVREEIGPAAPGFVLISSEAEKSEAGSLSKCGHAVLLQKPFSPEELAGALKSVSAEQLSPSSAKERGKFRVLIVDDSPAARLHVRRVLEGLGLSQFVEAADGAQAVAAAAREAFDLVVTDYNMPFMDGRGLVGYLKQNPATASTPIIMVTTETDPAKLEGVRQLGLAALCDKSFPPAVVGKIIEQLLGAP